MLVVTGIPLYFLEGAIGQFCSQGSVNVWRAVPILQGKNAARGSAINQSERGKIRRRLLVDHQQLERQRNLFMFYDW